MSRQEPEYNRLYNHLQDVRKEKRMLMRELIDDRKHKDQSETAENHLKAEAEELTNEIQKLEEQLSQHRSTPKKRNAAACAGTESD